MKNSVIIPLALQLSVDDVGWFKGADDRYIGRPSRTGMTRNHCPEDYTALNEIGKAIGQKINCLLVLGEWDKDNILRGEYGITYDPVGWNRAASIDLKQAEKCFEIAENSEFIDYSYHGVLHGNYTRDGKQITERECFYYKTPNDKLLSTQPEDEIAHRFELFFKLYNSWGFKKKLVSYVGPNGLPRNITNEEIMPLANTIKKYGIIYWSNGWKDMPGHIEKINDILFMEETFDCHIPWNACDVDPDYIKDFTPENATAGGNIISAHWPNFLRYNKENNLEYIDKWANYFKRQSEVFGLMTSKSLPFAANQSIFRKYSKIEIHKNIIKIDISDAVVFSPKHTFGEFYVSLKNNLVPKEVKGGSIEVYTTHKDFKTYRIKHTENIVEITVY